MLRKLILAAALAAALILALLAAPAAAQTDLSKVEIQADKLAEGVYVLRGAGGNMGLSVGPDGPFLIDDQVEGLTDRIVTAIRALDPQPVRFVFNTHWHGDHTGGNEVLRRAGALIVAQENVRSRLVAPQISPGSGRRVEPLPPGALPNITFSDTMTFHWNGEEICAIHVPPAHTDGDAILWFEKANVIHAGDLFFNGGYPLIDLTAGGSIDGLIAAADQLLRMADDRTRIIPGHGPQADRAALQAYRDMLAGVRAAVATEIATGKSKDGVIAAKPTAAYDEVWGKSFVKPDRFAGLVYESLARKQ